MADVEKQALVEQVMLSAREYGIHSVLYRHIIGDILGLNVTDMECLGILFHKGASSPTELAQYTGLTSGATTAMIDRLEKSGLVKRLPNPDDRRGKLIVIDKGGARRVSPLFASARRTQYEFISSYSEEELEFLADFLRRSVEILEREREKLRGRLAADA